MMKRIPLTILLALAAAAAESNARAERAGTAPQAEACDCPGCKFRAASEAVVEARRNLKEKREVWNKAQAEEDRASEAVQAATKALSQAQDAFNAAADALAAEDARA